MTAKGRLLFDEQAREKRRWTLFAAGACVVAGACMLFGVGQTFQLTIQDIWYGLRGDRDPSPQVVIVGIDGKALNAEEERWPWPRDRYVPLIEKLNVAAAKVMGFGLAATERYVYDPAYGRPGVRGLYQAKPPTYLDVPAKLGAASVTVNVSTTSSPSASPTGKITLLMM